MMNIRIVLFFIASLLDEAIVLGLLLWGLPRLGIEIPLPALVLIIVVLGIYAVVSFRLGVRAIVKKPLAGLSDMTGTRGRTVTPLAPEGTVKIKGELWQAVSSGGRLNAGEDIIVVSQDGLNLTVRRSGRNSRQP